MVTMFVRPLMLVSTAFLAAAASANPVLYTLFGRGSGGVGISSFYLQAFTIQAIGEASDVTSVGTNFFESRNLAATITLSYLGTFSIAEPMRIYSGSGYVGFDDPSGGPHSFYCDTRNGALAGYDLRTSVPTTTTGPGDIDTRGFVGTSGGTLNFGSVQDMGFSARALPVPEPASMAALFTGTALLARRSRRASRPKD